MTHISLTEAYDRLETRESLPLLPLAEALWALEHYACQPSRQHIARDLCRKAAVLRRYIDTRFPADTAIKRVSAPLPGTR